MNEPRELHVYESVTVPYAKVREALKRDALGLLHRATTGLASRAPVETVTLRAGLGSLKVGADVKIEIGDVRETASVLGERTTKVELTWRAVRAPGMFPSMAATLSVYPLSSTETQLDIHGRYRPPLGLVGNAADAVAGHRIAEESVRRLVQDLAAQINSELAVSPAQMGRAT